MDIEFIHHYTSVETLALILDSRKVRFNRLDRVNDVRESQIQQGIDFGKYFFVSCWTLEREESIPHWQMRENGMTGVRISLPITPFQRKLLKPKPEWNAEVKGNLFAPLSLDEQFGENYFVVPMFLEPKNFGGPVEYIDDIEERYAKAVEVTRQPNGSASMKISRPFDLVRLKPKEWAFQKEYRFFLLIVPSIELPPGGPGSPVFYKNFPNYVGRAMLNGLAPGIQYLDVDVSENALEALVVTTGPLCSPGNRLCVRALIEKYAPKCRIMESCLSGTIRNPSR